MTFLAGVINSTDVVESKTWKIQRTVKAASSPSRAGWFELGRS